MVEVYVMEATVVKIEKRVKILRGWKNEQDGTEFEHENTGWWIVLDNLMSIGVGLEKPSFEVGERIEIRIQRPVPAKEVQPDLPTKKGFKWVERSEYRPTGEGGKAMYSWGELVPIEEDEQDSGED